MSTVLLDEVDLRKRTERLYVEGRYEEALASAREGINYYTVHAINYFWVAECLMRLNRFEEALEMFYIGRDREPDSSGSYRRIAEPLIRLQRYNEALDALQQAKALAPDNVNAYLRSVDVHKLCGDNPAVASELIIASNACQDNADALESIAEKQLYYKLFDDAAKTAERIIYLWPDSSERSVLSASLLLRANRNDKAYSIISTVIADHSTLVLDPRIIDILCRCDKIDEARLTAERMIALDYANAEQCLVVADLLVINRIFDLGFQFYERGFLGIQEEGAVRTPLFKCLSDCSVFEDRMTFFKKLVKEADNIRSVEFRDVIISFFFLQRAGAQAKALMRLSTKNFPAYDRIVNIIRAECWRQIGQYRRSIFHYERAVMDYPTDASMRRICDDVRRLSEIEQSRVGKRLSTIFHDYKYNLKFEKVDIFYKTFKPDEQWLQYALLSANKYLRGYRNIIVIADEGDNMTIPDIPNIIYREIAMPPSPRLWGRSPGYCWQMGLKLSWTDYTDADAVLILDSDCIVTGYADVEECCFRGGPIWYYRPWELVGKSVAWKSSVDYFLGIDTPHAHMCRNGFFLTREATLAFQDFMMKEFNQRPLEYVMDSSRIFPACEYEMFGGYLHYVQRHGYIMKDVAQCDREIWPFKQYWSRAGISDIVRDELQKLIS